MNFGEHINVSTVFNFKTILVIDKNFIIATFQRLQLPGRVPTALSDVRVPAILPGSPVSKTTLRRPCTLSTLTLSKSFNHLGFASSSEIIGTTF